jgi:hypothetical protein
VPGSDRHDAVALLTVAAPYVLLLTATPHSGDRPAFDSLCRLGTAGTDPLLVFRRSRRQAGLGVRRRKHKLLVGPSQWEQRMHSSLDRFIRAVYDERDPNDRDLLLALTTLQKRALSSAWSLERSVARRLAILSGNAPDPTEPRQGDLPLGDSTDERDEADDVPVWTSRGFRDVEEERRLLIPLADAARAASSSETKLGALQRLVRRLRAMREPVIIFSEYRDTLLHVRASLPYPCEVLHGGMTRDERMKAIATFAAAPHGILLATDAAGEGLNLHHTCRVVVNLELPWNPVRLEQRAGRVDRIGQRRTVHAFHVIARETAETRVLERLSARIAQARMDIDGVDPLSATDDLAEITLSDLVSDGSRPGIQVPEQVAERPLYERPVLESKALAEHARLTQVRRLSGGWCPPGLLADAAPLLAFTRRAGVRSQLGTRMLVVVRSVIADSHGRTIALRLTPALVPRPAGLSRSSGRRAFARLRPLLDRVASALAERLDAQWEPQVAATHDRFWRVRMLREAAIATVASQVDDRAFQPGLFDRRAVARHLAAASERRELLEDSAHRQADARRKASLRRAITRLALVLVP